VGGQDGHHYCHGVHEEIAEERTIPPGCLELGGYFIRVLPNDNFSLDLRQSLVRYLLYMQFNTVYELKWYVTFEDMAFKLKLYCKYSSY